MMLVAAAARRRSRDLITSNLPPPCTDPIHSDKAVCVEATWCKGLPSLRWLMTIAPTGRGTLVEAEAGIRVAAGVGVGAEIRVAIGP